MPYAALAQQPPRHTTLGTDRGDGRGRFGQQQLLEARQDGAIVGRGGIFLLRRQREALDQCIGDLLLQPVCRRPIGKLSGRLATVRIAARWSSTNCRTAAAGGRDRVMPRGMAKPAPATARP